MPLQTANKTPDQPLPSTLRSTGARSATLPSKLIPTTQRERRDSSPAGVPDCETLFVHPTAKVIKFDAKPSSASSRPSPGARAGQDIGTLPWTTPTEMTVAAGPLCIYRIPTSGFLVSFLKSGTLLHPILIRTPCWCVDGESKFALRTPAMFYYRIELPNGNAEEKQLVAEFKIVLGQITRYEKAPCPFIRETQVAEIPRAPSPPPAVKPNRWKTAEKAKKWTRDSNHWAREEEKKLNSEASRSEIRPIKPMPQEDTSLSVQVAPSELLPDKRVPQEDEDSTYGPSEDGSSSPHDAEIRDLPSPELKPNPGPSVLPKTRSVTSPPNFSLIEQLDAQNAVNTEPSSSAVRPTLTRELTRQSRASSVNSFYSFTDATPELTDAASPSEPSTRSSSHVRRDSEDVLYMSHSHSRLPLRPRLSDMRRVTSGGNTPLVTARTDVLIDPFDAAASGESIPLRRLPRNASYRRGSSPLPQTTEVIKSTRSTAPLKLSSAVMQKTFDILTSPPAHLVALMMQIAARLVRRAQDFTVYESKGSRKMPGVWESDEEEPWGSDDEDDFGIPLRPLRSRSSTTSSIHRDSSLVRGRSVSRHRDGAD